MDNAVEAIGFGLVLGFLWFVWPPLVLAGGGALLVVWANTRTREARLGSVLGAAWAAARHAYIAGRDLEEDKARLRPVA